jgi:hypothetical protein
LLREVHPITPLAAEHAVGITIFSQDGLTIFGISADSESMPDLPVLALGIEEGIEDLMRSVHDNYRFRQGAHATGRTSTRT